eukprot:CAMPEP_0182419370 /NCGR_PEP_ID=MMETSP1167-20130531/3831_1 /TAXON_ID=2988 /ORGANISM="Mallomonas Sp, Strain CCMP3275" /LENGTH=112 /DNA_ID=CAMNT_0024594251 /DNA_START=335 /DNA_END=673 /DNA_ORIENTATION=-
MNRKMVCRMLASRVEHIEQAEDGVSAVNEVAKYEQLGTPFHFVLMDYEMPNMDGPTAAKELRAMGFRGKIIGVTGNTMPADIHSFMAHGADDVLTKPLDVEALDRAFTQDQY